MENYFKGSPTVGNHVPAPEYTELSARLSAIENRPNHTDSSPISQAKKWWDTVKEIAPVAAPILTLLPATIRAIAKFRETTNVRAQINNEYAAMALRTAKGQTSGTKRCVAVAATKTRDTSRSQRR